MRGLQGLTQILICTTNSISYNTFMQLSELFTREAILKMYFLAHESFWTMPTFHWNHAHFALLMLLGHSGKSFLVCSNAETNGKSIRTDFIATYSWNFIWYLIVWPIIAWTGMVLAVGALPPFPAGWGGMCPRWPPPPPVPTPMDTVSHSNALQWIMTAKPSVCVCVCVCVFLSCLVTHLLPRTRAQEVKQSVRTSVVIVVVVVVGTKIATLRDQGIWATRKYDESVEIGEKPASVCLDFFGMAHERHK